MAEFFNNLTSISWWIGVVIVGLVIHIVGTYLKSPIDRLFSSISTKYQTRSKAKKAVREARIANLVGNRHEQILHASKTNFTLVMSLIWHLFAMFFFIVALLMEGLKLERQLIGPSIAKESLEFKILLSITYMMVVLSMFRGTSRYIEAIDDRKILKEAKNRESKAEGSN